MYWVPKGKATEKTPSTWRVEGRQRADPPSCPAALPSAWGTSLLGSPHGPCFASPPPEPSASPGWLLLSLCVVMAC